MLPYLGLQPLDELGLLEVGVRLKLAQGRFDGSTAGSSVKPLDVSSRCAHADSHFEDPLSIFPCEIAETNGANLTLPDQILHRLPGVL